MFDIGSTELLLIVIVAVIVIGPKDLPRALYKVGQIVGKARAMSRHFRTGIDAMVREVELAELEKKWAAENKRIMEEHPPEVVADVAPEALPAPAPLDPDAADSAMPAYNKAAQGVDVTPAETGTPPKDGATA